MTVIRVGTRRSALATAQTTLVLNELRAAHPSVTFEIVFISTEGDERRDVSLRAIAGQGVFVKRIEQALIDGSIDLAIHSLKDMPTAIEPGLIIAAVPTRADTRDALVLPVGTPRQGISIAGDPLSILPTGARVGTGSPRRAVQLTARRPDLTILDIRGNVDSRLRKLDDGDYDAIVLAVAGLQRLGQSDRISVFLGSDVMVPMIGQGALALEARANDQVVIDIARSLDDATSHTCVDAERAFLATLGSGCALPVGALATMRNGHVTLITAIETEAGIVRRTETCSPGDAVAVARRIARPFVSTAPALP